MPASPIALGPLRVDARVLLGGDGDDGDAAVSGEEIPRKKLMPSMISTVSGMAAQKSTAGALQQQRLWRAAGGSTSKTPAIPGAVRPRRRAQRATRHRDPASVIVAMED